MVTSPMMSRDPERSRSWPQYIWASISQNPFEIERQFQWSTYRKSYNIGNRTVTWPITSRDPERSRWRPRFIWSLISRKQFKIACQCQRNTYRKSRSRSRMVSYTLKLSFPLAFSIRLTYVISEMRRDQDRLTCREFGISLRWPSVLDFPGQSFNSGSCPGFHGVLDLKSSDPLLENVCLSQYYVLSLSHDNRIEATFDNITIQK